MLEEIKFDYKITEVDLSKGDQFNKDFRKISPLSKIPAITDHKNKISFYCSHNRKKNCKTFKREPQIYARCAKLNSLVALQKIILKIIYEQEFVETKKTESRKNGENKTKQNIRGIHCR